MIVLGLLALSMGASDWAGAMATKMHREYEVGQERALQITNRVRKLVASPDIEALEEAGLLNKEFTSDLIQDLIALLNDQDEETIEGRWNGLVRELGIYDVVGADAFLYDPASGGLDPDKELVSDDGDSITIQEAMITAWREELPIEAIPHGIRLGNTEFRTGDSRQITLSQYEDRFDQDVLSDQLSLDLRRRRLEVDADLLALENVDFSMKAPRQDCVLAIAAARRYILEHGGVSRDEIVEALEPEKNHPLGSNGVQARAKGFEYEFRQRWWEDVVAPGLRSLPDIQEPTHESGKWLSTEAMTGGFESETTVETILDVGYLFEIAYLDDNEEQRVVGYHNEITRPSAKPLHGPPVFRFQPIVGNPPITIRLPALRELHPISFEQLPDPVWDSAISELVAIADENAEQIPLGDVEVVLEASQNGQVEAATALEFIAMVFGEREDVRETVADDFETMLLARLDLLTDREQAAEIAKCFGIVAEVAPKRVLDAVPAMASAADSATLETRRWLLYTFSNVAEAYPEELLPAVEILINSIDEPDENLRTNALSTLGEIAQAYPDAAGDIVDSLGELLTNDDALVRANAAGLLADIAQSNPEDVIELAPELAESLTADDDETRVHTSITLLRAGEANPKAVRDEHEQLVAALSDSNSTVRANTCTLIGNADAPVPVDQLRLLKDDPDEQVQEQATWALGRIS
ncbi:HEAT repeat domain-containing protein [Natronorubrum tibetense]|uniref:Adaptin n=1 Tax=Natronorubrum tibetense GA33 TaxID=1114856 RepID=L9VS25_9EURY|nr:HEAT repeat domain-containing protein [Natronorubrum tibetense]ELY39861.1 adaptin [Natronorubrum tibetense GA33]